MTDAERQARRRRREDNAMVYVPGFDLPLSCIDTLRKITGHLLEHQSEDPKAVSEAVRKFVTETLLARAR